MLRQLRSPKDMFGFSETTPATQTTLGITDQYQSDSSSEERYGNGM